MAKGFQKGHPKFEPKLRAMRTRQLAQTVREHVSTDVMVWFHEAVVMGKDAKLTKDASEARPGMWDSDCELGVAWPDNGLTPSLAERQASMKWLSDRGHGQAPQMVQVEASLRGSDTGNGSIANLLPSTAVLEIGEMIARLLGPGSDADSPAGSTVGGAVIDAESVELTPAQGALPPTSAE